MRVFVPADGENPNDLVDAVSRTLRWDLMNDQRASSFCGSGTSMTACCSLAGVGAPASACTARYSGCRRLRRARSRTCSGKTDLALESVGMLDKMKGGRLLADAGSTVSCCVTDGSTAGEEAIEQSHRVCDSPSDWQD